jgi:hypothetical protein
MRSRLVIGATAIVAFAVGPAQAAGVGGPLNLITGAPVWVWPLLALLVYSGILAMRPRVVSWRRAIIVAIVFIGWGIAGLLGRAGLSPVLAATWLVAATSGGVLALGTSRFAELRADRGRGLVELPGSALPLARSLLVFTAKYALGVAAALYPEMRGDIAFWDVAVSGLGAGYFLGWSLRFAEAYRRAPAIAAIAEVRS